MGELATLRDLKLPVVIVVFVDKSLALIELKQRRSEMRISVWILAQQIFRKWQRLWEEKGDGYLTEVICLRLLKAHLSAGHFLYWLVKLVIRFTMIASEKISQTDFAHLNWKP